MGDLVLEKTCPSCKTKNAGMLRRCRACGAELPTAGPAVAPKPGVAAIPLPGHAAGASAGAAKVRLIHPGGGAATAQAPLASAPAAAAPAPSVPAAVSLSSSPGKIRIVHPAPPHDPQFGPHGTVPMSPADVQQALTSSAGVSQAPHVSATPPVQRVPVPAPVGGSRPTAGLPSTHPIVPAVPSRPSRRTTGGLTMFVLIAIPVGAVIIALLGAWRGGQDKSPDPAPIPVPTASAAPSTLTAPSATLTADPGPGTRPSSPPPASSGPHALNEDFRERLKKATVLIQVKSTLQRSMGSGFFVDADGLIATNHHVVDGPGKISVRLYGTQQDIEDVTCVAEDAKRDLALLRLGGIRPEHVLKLHQGAGVPETTPVVVVGHPRGELWSMTLGTVTGYRTEQGQPFLGTDARIEPGNSGGPVAMQSDGEVIGISDWKINNTSMNYAIPVAALIDFIRLNGNRPGSPCSH